MLERLNQDIKAALLSGNHEVVEALRFIKNSLDQGAKEKGSELGDQEIVLLLRKEVKKREEAAGLFTKGGNSAAADKERKEAALIRGYMPAEMSEKDIEQKIISIIAENNIPLEVSSMGRVMSLSKQALGDSADSSLIAKVASQLLKSGQ